MKALQIMKYGKLKKVSSMRSEKPLLKPKDILVEGESFVESN
jgi:hypothetical protein